MAYADSTYHLFLIAALFLDHCLCPYGLAFLVSESGLNLAHIGNSPLAGLPLKAFKHTTHVVLHCCLRIRGYIFCVFACCVILLVGLLILGTLCRVPTPTLSQDQLMPTADCNLTALVACGICMTSVHYYPGTVPLIGLASFQSLMTCTLQCHAGISANSHVYFGYYSQKFFTMHTSAFGHSTGTFFASRDFTT